MGRKKKIIILDLSFVEDEYRDAWETWMAYKSQIGNPYKTQMGVERAYRDLKKKAEFIPAEAMRLVDNAISREWLGIYKTKEDERVNKDNRGNIYDAVCRLL